MGRADLARFRKTVLSVSPPAEFPQRVYWVLQSINSYPNCIAHAVRSLYNAPTQRAQAVAIKLLGKILHEAHHPSAENSCACRLHVQYADLEETAVCQLIIPILTSFLFHAPDATQNLVSTSLGAMLRCSDLDLPDIEEAFTTFFQSLETTASNISKALEHPRSAVETTPITSLTCQINAAAAILSDPSTKPRIMHRISRICAVFKIACCIAELFLLFMTNSNDSPIWVKRLITDTNKDSRSINSSLIASACDSAMKSLQDILSSLFTNVTELANDSVLKYLTQQSVDCCQRLLKSSCTPRSCSLACAIVYVTGRLFLHGTHVDSDILVHIVRTDLLSQIFSFPPFSQLSLLRAIMEAPAVKAALPVVLFPPATATVDEVKKDFETVFGLLISLTNASSDVHFRYLAMETINVCIWRAAPSKLGDGCRDAVLSLVYQRWEEPFAGITSQMRETMNALVSVDGGDENAIGYWCKMTATLMKGDWHSKGMYGPLCVLVNRIGASKFLDIEPDCQLLAMLALSRDSRLTKAVSDWLDTLWTKIKLEFPGDLQYFLQVTAAPLLNALVNDTDRGLRMRVAEHVLPVYMRSADKQYVLQISQALLHRLSEMKQKKVSEIRGSIMIMSVARKNGASISNFSDPVVRSLLDNAMKSLEEDVRSSGFDLAITSSVLTEPISQAELDMVLAYLPIALMSNAEASDRSRFRESMRRFLERLAICRHAAVHGTGGWWTKKKKELRGQATLPDLELLRRQLLKRLEAFEISFIQLLFCSSTPASSSSRRAITMEVLSLAAKNICINSFFDESNGHSLAYPAALLAGIEDEWERARRASYEAMQSLQPFLPSLSCFEHMQALQKYALPLLNSPRQKNADSGASICRVVFQKLVKHGHCSIPNLFQRSPQNHDIFLSISDNREHSSIHVSSQASPALYYAMSVIDSLDESIQIAGSDLRKACEHGLFYGKFLLLRYILQDFSWKAHNTAILSKNLDILIRKFVDVSDKCLRIALDGVFIPKMNMLMNKNKYGLTTTAADLSEEEGNEIFLNEGKQLENTSCFLSAKEICVSLGILCHQAPLCCEIGMESDCAFLDGKLVEEIGGMYVFVFMNTRHWGVIDGASEGLQLLCERLLSSSSLHFQSLPKRWALNILSKALEGELYVLRRSAGIPWMIAAIVNAEASVNRRSHDAPLLNEIVELLLKHLSCIDVESVVENGSNTKHPKKEESISHALNLLRGLFLNSNIASNIMKQIENATILCINFFCSTSWLIRNSAMMLYTALIRRGIGVCREREDKSTQSSFKAVNGTSATLHGVRRLSGTTAFQFFSRHPKLHPFLLNHLNRAVQAEFLRGGNHPVLYPTLYLLSCLSPNTNEDPTKDVSMKKFWKVVRECSHWRTEYVRRAAAAACVPLISDISEVPKIVRKLLIDLPPEPPKRSSELRGVVSCTENPAQNFHVENSVVNDIKQNCLHGDLLTISAILRNTISVMCRRDKMSLVTILAETLPRYIWIAVDGSKNVCSVTRASMVEIIGLSYRLAQDMNCESNIGGLSLLATCEDASKMMVSRAFIGCLPQSEIGSSALRIKSVRLFGEVVVQTYISQQCNFSEAVALLCTDDEMFKMDGFITKLEMCSTLLRISSGTCKSQKETNLEPELVRLWELVEKALKVTGKAETSVAGLSLWLSLLDFDHGHLIADLSSPRIDDVMDLMENDGCVDVQERALIIVSQLVGLGKSGRALTVNWMKSLMEASNSHASTLRIAVCTGIEKVRVSNYKTRIEDEAFKEMVVQGYLILSSLMEDDNSEVKRQALQVAQKCVNLDTNNDSSEHVLPTLMRIYNLLGTRFGESRTLLQRLETSLGNNTRGDDLIKLVGALMNSQLDRDTEFMDAQEKCRNKGIKPNGTGRLFRLEEACEGGETILQMQLIAWCYVCAIHARVHSKNFTHHLNIYFITTLAEGVLQELMVTVENYSGNEFVSMMDAPMFKPAGFTHCVRLTLRLFLVMQCTFVIKSDKHSIILSDISQKLETIIVKFGSRLHPVIHYSLKILIETCADSDRKKIDQRILYLLPP